MRMNDFLKAYDEFMEARIQETLDYQRFNAYLVTHHSTSIEGSTLTKVETDLLLDKGITPKGKPLAHSLMVEDHYNALKFVLERAKEKEAITQKLIKQIASKIMSRTGDNVHTALGEFDVRKGDYRLVSAYSGSHYYPAYNKIPNRMTQLVAGIQSEMEKLDGVEAIYTLSFDAHFELVTIHPFGDGNGRTSRLLMNYIQAYFNLPLTTVFMEDREQYIEALMSSRKKESPQPIREFMSKQASKYFTQEVDQKKEGEKGKGLSFVF